MSGTMRIRKLHRPLLSRPGCLILAALLCLIPAFIHAADSHTKTVARYTVSSLGFDIGTVTTTQQMVDDGDVPRYDFETKTAVKASFLWLGYRMDILEKGTLRNGNLVEYSRTGMENGARVAIEGKLEHAAFRFTVHERGATRAVVIPRSSYDYTTMECPEAQLDFSRNPDITLHILDVEKMAVVSREYRFIKDTFYSLGDRKLPCRIVDFSDKNKKSRRWITWDGSAVVLYRQDGSGEHNSYSVRATSVTRTR